MPMVRAVCSVPYHSMLDDATGEPSHNCRPKIEPTDENGPNVIAAVFDAEPAGDAAAPNSAVMREYPVSVPISEPDTDVGVPAARPAHSATGRVGVAPCKHQSKYALSKSVFFVLCEGSLSFVSRLSPNGSDYIITISGPGARGQIIVGTHCLVSRGSTKPKGPW